MSITCIAAHELTPDLRARWAYLQENNPAFASPFFCPEFTTILGAHHEGIYVSIVREGNDVTGFFSFHRGKNRIAYPLPMCDYQGIVSAPDATVDVKALLKASGLIACDFEQLIANQSLLCQADHATTYPLRVVRLSEGYASYERNLKHMHSGRFSTIMRKMRKLEREAGTLMLQSEVADLETLRTLLGWKSLKYNQGNRYESWRVKCFENMFRLRSPNFQGVLSALYADKHLIAAHFGLRSGRVLHWWFPAYDPVWARYSPGSILLLKMAEVFAGRGVVCLDLGAGSEAYKIEFGNDTQLVSRGAFELPSAITTRRKIGRLARRAVLKNPCVHATAKSLRNFFAYFFNTGTED